MRGPLEWLPVLSTTVLRSLSSDAVIKVLTSWFNLFGWPSSTEVMEARNFAESYPASVQATELRMRFPRHTTRRAAA